MKVTRRFLETTVIFDRARYFTIFLWVFLDWKGLIDVDDWDDIFGCSCELSVWLVTLVDLLLEGSGHRWRRRRRHAQLCGRPAQIVSWSLSFLSGGVIIVEILLRGRVVLLLFVGEHLIELVVFDSLLVVYDALGKVLQLVHVELRVHNVDLRLLHDWRRCWMVVRRCPHLVIVVHVASRGWIDLLLEVWVGGGRIIWSQEELAVVQLGLRGIVQIWPLNAVHWIWFHIISALCWGLEWLLKIIAVVLFIFSQNLLGHLVVEGLRVTAKRLRSFILGWSGLLGTSRRIWVSF